MNPTRTDGRTSRTRSKGATAYDPALDRRLLAEPRRPVALVPGPTRELAPQVTDALTPCARAVEPRPATVVGGVPIRRQAGAPRNGAGVVAATNVAARGIPVDRLGLVVDVDPPAGHKDCLQRSGRTARAGASGSVVTLVTGDQRRDMTRLMTAAGIVPETAQVRSGDDALVRITGAQNPLGIPVTITAPPTEQRRERGTASRGRGAPAATAWRSGTRRSAGTAA